MTRIEDQPTVTSLGHCADSTATSAAVTAHTDIATTGGDPGVDARGVDSRRVAMPREIGGRAGLEPTRYGDWELRGRCIDF